MNSRDLIGRTIVELNQSRFLDKRTGSWVTNFHSIVLDNGRRVYFNVIELDNGYAVEGHVTKRPMRPTKPPEKS